MGNPLKDIFATLKKDSELFENIEADQAARARGEKPAAKAGAFGMLGIIEKNKAMLEKLPQALDQWGAFMVEMSGALKRIEINTQRIIHILEPGGLDERTVQEMRDNAQNDPRNKDFVPVTSNEIENKWPAEVGGQNLG